MPASEEFLRVDASRRELWVSSRGRWSRRDGLTIRELQLLETLLAERGRPVSRERLLETVWGGVDGVSPGVVDKHVASLRKKLGAVGRRISSIYGVGYVLA